MKTTTIIDSRDRPRKVSPMVAWWAERGSDLRLFCVHSVPLDKRCEECEGGVQSAS